MEVRKSNKILLTFVKNFRNKINYIGNYGQGMSVKVLNNFVESCSVVAVRNILFKSVSFGIKPKQLLNVLKDSSGQTWFTSNLDNIDWFRENYNGENTIVTLEKDVKSFMLGVNKHIPNNKSMQNIQNVLIEGLKNIPSYHFKN